MKTKNQKKLLDSRVLRRGQSLIEAMVAISILTTGFLGIAALLARSFVLNRTIADETTANYLAAEGIEITKNLIDHDVYESLSSNPAFSWGSCFSSFNNIGVELDYTTVNCNDFTAFIGNGHPLYYNPTTHLYSYDTSGGVVTNFSREILVDKNGNEMTVDAIVYWTSDGISQNLKLEDVFYDWQQ